VFNEEERREELRLLSKEDQGRFDEGSTKSEFFNTIISQEKSMIEEAKEEAVREFAEKLKDERSITSEYDYIVYVDDIDKLLKEYKVEI
jgi:hypothetical protein